MYIQIVYHYTDIYTLPRKIMLSNIVVFQAAVDPNGQAGNLYIVAFVMSVISSTLLHGLQ